MKVIEKHHIYLILFSCLSILGWFLLTIESAEGVAWTLTDASYDNKSFLFSSQLEDGMGLFFKDDGTVMYISGGQVPAIVAQYNLSTPWDVSTASYASKQYSFFINGIHRVNQIFFKPDGSEFYAANLTNSPIGIHQYSLSTAWDVSTASFVASATTTVSTVDGAPSGISFKSDGTKIFMSGNNGDRVYQFSLGTPWDITTISYDSISLRIGDYVDPNGSTQGVFVSSDGTRFYTIDDAIDKISQFTLSVGWDLSSVVNHIGNLSTVSQGTTPYEVFLKSDGGKMYFVDFTNRRVYQYSLADTTAPTVSSFSPLDNAIDVTMSGTFRITFNEAVSTSTGNITLKKTSDDTTVETIDVTSDKVSRFSSTAFTIDPASSLSGETEYYFLIDSGAFVDSVSNAYAGISLATTWNFISERSSDLITSAPTSITGNTAQLNGSITSIKSSAATSRGFVYSTTTLAATNWALVGSGLSISGVGTPALAGLNSTDVAFIDSTNDSLRTYRFDGTNWALVGSGLSISGVGTPALAGLNSTDVAFIDSTNDSLRTYRFDGTNWALVGSGLSISGVGAPFLAVQSSSTVSFLDSTAKQLRVYRFTGSSWAQVGNNSSLGSIGDPSLAAINGSGAVFIDSTNDSLRYYDFGPGNVAPVSSGYASSTAEAGSFSTGSYSASVDNLVEGTTYYVRSYAQNSNGYSYGSEVSFTTLSDVSAPTVSVTAPSDASTVSGASVTISANATDDTEVAGVKFYVDNILQGNEDISSPYSIVWDTTTATSGSKSLIAVARDSAGNTATSSAITVTVANEPTPSSIGVSTNETSATITWTTPFEGSSRIYFGVVSALASSTNETNTTTRVTNHSVSLSGLLSCTVYSYLAVSKNVGNDIATTTSSTMKTSGCTGSSPISGNTESNIETASGGSLVHDTLTLTVPVSFTATSTSVNFQANTLDPTSFITSAGSPNSLTRVGNVYHMKAFLDESTQLSLFSQALTVNIVYVSGDVSGVVESSLKIFRFSNSVWTELSNCSVNTGTKTVSCTTTEFSEFAIFGEQSPSSEATENSSISGGSPPPRPTPPPLGYSVNVVVNDLDSNFVDFFFVYGLDIIQIAISDNPEFAPGLYFNASTNMRWLVGEEHQLYVKFCNRYYQCSDTLPVTLQKGNKPSLNVETPLSTCNFLRQLDLRMRGEDVRCLQKFLNENNFLLSHAGPGSKGQETDYFGTLTQSALSKFQSRFNISPADGVLRTTLIEVIGWKNVRDISPLSSENVEESLSRDLKQGMSGEDVRMLQKFLNSHGFNLTGFGFGSFGNETTYFGPLTKNALMRYQDNNSSNIYSLEEIKKSDGVLSGATRRYINLHIIR